jgi:hypothetical protein
MLEIVRSTLAQVVLASSDEAALELMETRRRISRKVQKKTQDDEDAQSVVRDDTFLPELDMRSPIPMAYLLRVGGARALGRYLLRQKEDVELAIQNGFDPKLAGARRLGEDEASVQAAADRDLCEHDTPVEEPAPKSRRRRGP